MKYFHRITQDEDQRKEEEAHAITEIAENTAERSLLDMKHERVKLKREIDKMKSAEGEAFDLKEIVRKQHRVDILLQRIETARNIMKELF